MKVTELPLSEIKADSELQAREEIDSEKVSEYRAAMEEGTEFPACVVFSDGDVNWLADGFHRYYACTRGGFKKMRCEVRQGTRRDAILYAVGCNGSHGLPRTNADKHKSVMMLLEDEEWKKWSNQKISKACSVSANFVGEIRNSLSSNDSEPRKYITKHGTESTMKTANIGGGLRHLASEIGEDGDEPTAVEPLIPNGKQYINGDTGEEIDNLVTVTTKETRSGRGINIGYEAINLLKSIPAKDPLRVDGLEVVERWIRDNK